MSNVYLYTSGILLFYESDVINFKKLKNKFKF